MLITLSAQQSGGIPISICVQAMLRVPIVDCPFYTMLFSKMNSCSMQCSLFWSHCMPALEEPLAEIPAAVLSSLPRIVEWRARKISRRQGSGSVNSRVAKGAAYYSADHL